MTYKAKSIRAFIGAKDFNESKTFYQQLGFEEIPVGDKMSYFKISDQIGFYLQDYYVKDWIDNSMIFLEVEDLDALYQQLLDKKLQEQYEFVRFSTIKDEDWGRAFFMHDPSGVLWHFGVFK